MMAAQCPFARAQAGPEPAVSPGSVTGQVISRDGALLSGARITLSNQRTGATQRAQSGPDGHFGFPAVAPGTFVLSVALPGFTSFTEAVTVAPAEQVTAPQAVLTLATVDFSVDAITPEQAALQELHAEEHQRLAGVLPNFFVSYNWTAPPLTARQKFALSTHNVLDPGNLALVGVVAGVQQAADAFPGYHQGAAGYGKRFGADLANLVVGSYMGGAVLPSLFHQDPRYFFKGTGTKRSRFVYAVSRVAITRGDNGRNQPNYAGVLGDLSASALSNIYYPASDRQGATLFLENGLLSLAGDAMNNVVQEFFLNHITTRGKKHSEPH